MKFEPKKILWIDIETDGLDPTIIHCICTIDGLGNQRRYSHEAGNLAQGLRALEEAECLIGHNIVAYDLQALLKVYPTFHTEAVLQDTLVCARLTWPHIRDLDFKRKDFPKELIGSQSLKAWGVRLGFPKYDYGDDLENPWEKWSQEMEDYCMRDAEVCHRLYQEFLREDVPVDAVSMEHEIHELMETMTHVGFYFDRKAAEKLYVRLLAKKDQLSAELQELFPPKEVHLKTKTKLVPFNPGSRVQIAERFEQQGWEPKEYTPDGRPKISETILESMEDSYPEASSLNEYLLVQKRIGQIAEGKNSWLGLVEDDDRIHGRVISCGGTISHRMSHFSPNLSACPNLGSKYGKECRSLFSVPSGYKLVGTDLAGAELRLLAHALAFYDNGKFARVCEEGDPHQQNADRLKISRSEAKRVQFALIYGGGDQMLGECVGGSRREGGEIRYRFYKANPAFPKLLESIQQKAKSKGFLIGLDGRKLYPRSQHSCLNLWIQNATITCAKKATLIHIDLLADMNIRHQIDFNIVAHVHDEWQLEVIEQHAEDVAEVAPLAIREAGNYYGLNVRLDGDTSIGSNWSETH
ncbi:MAG: putative DNA polymerase [Prokaryotic dsDNA virus sp.]|nr:MAG: putative DNA polymerase [Prokaryotic dsDNA virus sp.]|tara:strand:+ start:1570 stop:3309 length:1740 start_codon:yes stop_codon:yes gene_type:complete